MTQAETRNIGSTFRERIGYVYSRYGLKGLYRGIVPGSQGVFMRSGASISVMLLFQDQATKAGLRDSSD